MKITQSSYSSLEQVKPELYTSLEKDTWPNQQKITFFLLLRPSCNFFVPAAVVHGLLSGVARVLLRPLAMHTPLAPHLHTEECNKVIAELMKCHAEYSKLRQLFGVCNDLDVQMRYANYSACVGNFNNLSAPELRRCTKAERLAKVEAAHARAKDRIERTQQRMREAKGQDWRQGKMYGGGGGGDTKKE